MLKNIIIKEILDHLKSLRLMLTTLLLIITMILSAIIYIPEYKNQMKDYNKKANQTLKELSRNVSSFGALFRVFSYNWDGPWVYKRPNHLSFIAEGHDNNLPNAFAPSAFRIYGPVKKVRTNLFLWRSESIDWALIIGIILSFTSLLLVYDGITGEKEQGTLRLSLVNSVSRATFIFGKFIGALITLSFALLVGIILHLLILIIGGIPISGEDWILIGLSFVFSITFISAFLMLGFLISAMTKQSTTSLVVSLLTWALIVIIIPRLGGLFSSKISPIPSYYLVRTNANEMETQAIENYNRENPDNRSASYSGHWSPGEPLERALVTSDAWSKAMDEYRNKMINQVEIARKLTLISPFSSFQYGLEALIESGIFHYKIFFQKIQDYKMSMRQYMIDKYPKPLKWHIYKENVPDEEREKARLELFNIKLDFESIPKFEEKRSPLNHLIMNSLTYFIVLFLFTVLFFAGAFVKFLKYDIR